ncbi:MAG: CopD family protein [Cytophagales bacterium]|nr:CopD family protein [Cytophagales bacterium]
MLIIKSLHLIFVITWFAALFYMPRLMIYYTEAEAKSEPEKSILQAQFLDMMRRLWYGIAWPSAILTYFLGYALWYMWHHIHTDWMIAKLVMVTVLYVYFGYTHYLYLQLKKGKIILSALMLRMWNEAATVLLFGIVFVIVLKNTVSWVWVVGGSVVFGILICSVVWLMNKKKMNNEK